MKHVHEFPPFKNIIFAFLMTIGITLLVDGYYDIKQDNAMTRRAVREQEIRLHNIKVRLDQFERIGVEVAVIDKSTFSDIIYAELATMPDLDIYFHEGNRDLLLKRKED